MENIILPLHIAVLVFTAWNIFKADHLGFEWMTGKKPLLDENVIKKYHHRTLIGLILMVTTGFLLFLPMKEYLLGRTQFYVKMGFVFALITNSFAIGNLLKVPTQKTFASLTSREKIPLLISGVTSTVCWLGAATGGFYLLP